MGSSAPPAGRAPIGKPRPAPLSQAFQLRRQSLFESIRPPSMRMISPPAVRPCQARYIASPTANKPTAAIVTSMPSSNSAVPKVNRGCPVCKSIPTKPKSRPRASAIRPRKTERPSTADTATSASTINAAYSAGPKASAASTTSGAKNVKASVPIVPATKLPMAAVASAGPPRPLRAILLPSSAVTSVADSPGVLSKIEVVDPPYIAP